MADARTVAVYFITRATSGVGRRMDSVLARLELQHKDVLVHRVDADSEPELARRLGVREIPSVVIVSDMRPFARLSGRASLEEIAALLGASSTAAQGR